MLAFLPVVGSDFDMWAMFVPDVHELAFLNFEQVITDFYILHV